MIKLARIGYKAKEGETVIDITVKNNPNHVLSTTWDLVMGFKKGEISWDEYTEQYLDLIRNRWRSGRKKELVDLAWESRLKTFVFVCFCADENICHRSLAKALVDQIRETYFE